MRTMQQHPVTTDPVRDRGRFGAAGMLMTAVCVAGALGLALSGTGGSYAMWNDTASVDAGSLTSGSAGLTATWQAGHDRARWQDLLPGEAVRQPLVLANTGAVPLTISASVSAASPSFEIRTVAGSCPTTPLSVAPLAGAPSAVTRPSTPPVPVVLDANASVAACVEVRTTATAAPAATTAFTIVIDGKQAP